MPKEFAIPAVVNTVPSAAKRCEKKQVNPDFTPKKCFHRRSLGKFPPLKKEELIRRPISEGKRHPDLKVMGGKLASVAYRKRSPALLPLTGYLGAREFLDSG
jgi:hypothetical protein